MNTSFEALKLKAQLEHLTSAPTLENANALLSQIERNKNENFQFVQDLFLSNLLLTADEATGLKKNEIKAVLFKCVVLVLRGSRLKKDLPYKTLLMIVIKQIFDFETNSYRANLSEELKISLFECIEIASRHLDSDAIEAFMVEKNKIILSQCIFVCKEAIAKEKYSKIRKTAIEALISVMQLHDNADFTDVVLRDQISQIVFLVLPQISAVLLKASLEDTVKGSALVQTATKAIGRYLCLVLEDYEKKSSAEVKPEDFLKLVLEKENEVDETSVLQPKNQSQLEFLQNLRKTSDWIKAVVKRLMPSVEKLKILRGSEHTEVRNELAILSWNFLQKCLVNVKPMIPFLLENLILFSDDSDEKIRDFSLKSMEKLSKTLPEINNKVDELFSLHLTAMPRIILTGDDSEKLAGLTLLNSFVMTVTSGHSRQLNNLVLLEKFINILLSCCEVEVSDDLLFFEHNPSGFEDHFYQLKTPWRHLKHLKNLAVEKKFTEICRHIGKSNSAEVCVNFLLGNMNSIEYLVLLIEVLEENPKLESIQVEGIVEEFLNETYWSMEIRRQIEVEKRQKKANDEWFQEKTPGLYESAIEVRLRDVSLADEPEKNEKLELKRLKYNILSTCLVIEVIGKSATILEQNFSKFLPRVLHELLEKAGNSNYLIRTAGVSTLVFVASALNFTGIPQLVHANSENLLENIQRLLKEDHENEAVIDLLSVVFKFSEGSLTENVKEVVETAADQISTAKYMKNVSGYLRLFRLYVASVQEFEAKIDENDEIEIEESWNEFLKSCLHELKKPADDLNEKDPLENLNCDAEHSKDPTENPPESSEEPVEQPWVDESKILPAHIKLIIKILTCSLPFFASSIASEVILTHEIFTNALSLLHHFENQLLPMVHQLWYPFSKQFQFKNPVVLQHSIRLLSLIAELAKDFVTKKSTKDIIPVINKFLDQSFKPSNKKENLSFTQDFKLQKEILINYGSLAVNLELDEKSLDEIVEILLKYEKHSNETLSKGSKTSLDALKHYDPGLILLKSMF